MRPLAIILSTVLPLTCRKPVTAVPFPGFRQLPSAGRYYVKSFVANKRMVLQRNPYYHGPAPGSVHTMVIQGCCDPNLVDITPLDAVGKVSNGNADLAEVSGNVTSSLLKQASAFRKLHRLRAVNSSCVTYLAMNATRAVFKSAAARRAVNYALNRRKLADSFGVVWLPHDELLPPDIPGYKPFTTYARQSLTTASKVARGHTGRINFFYTARFDTAAPLITNWLQQAGFTVKEVRFPTGHALNTELARPDTTFDLMQHGNCSNFPDPASFFYDLFGPGNPSHFQRRAVTARLNRAGRLPAPARYRAFGAADHWVMKHYAPYAPLAVDRQLIFLGPHVDPHSIHIHPVYGVILSELRLKRS
jgi:ABC-type transport system substrate-binding protein